MRRIIAVLASLAAFAPLSAHAEERMSDARFLTASRCLAYADAAPLQADGIDYSALRAAISTGGARDTFVYQRANRYEHDVRMSANRARRSEQALTRLRAARDEACQPFIARGLVQLNTPTARS